MSSLTPVHRTDRAHDQLVQLPSAPKNPILTKLLAKQPTLGETHSRHLADEELEKTIVVMRTNMSAQEEEEYLPKHTAAAYHAGYRGYQPPLLDPSTGKNTVEAPHRTQSSEAGFCYGDAGLERSQCITGGVIKTKARKPADLPSRNL